MQDEQSWIDEKFQDPDQAYLAKLRHSAAHVLAQAVQRIWPQARLAVGPPVEDGFYYDIEIPGVTISEEDFPQIEQQMKRIVKENQPFEMVPWERPKLISFYEETDRVYKLDLLERMNCLDRVCVASFSDSRLRAARARFGERVCLSSGPRSVAVLRFGSWRAPVGVPDVACAQIPLSQYGVPLATGGFLRHCNRHGIAVHVWTIDEEAEMRRLIRLGVNGIVTDRPSVLKRVAQEEGVW